MKIAFLLHSTIIWTIPGVMLLLLSTTGCQQQVGQELLGTWIGRPDNAAARAEREALKYGKNLESAELQNTQPVRNETDWEAYEVEVTFDFVDKDKLKMSLANGAEPIAANWRVLETSPTGCTIEVLTASPKEGEPVVRHFELELDERDGTIVGFLLSETGADRQLGALYFSRAP